MWFWAIMNPNKCYLLSLLVLLTFLSNLVKVSSKQKIYKKVFFNHDHNECVCFEQNRDLVTVPQHLNPQNKEIERLIIILYKTKNGTIYTYVPNRVKQSAIPDLQYETDDSITNIPNKLLDTLFLNSNKSIKYLQPGNKPMKSNELFVPSAPVEVNLFNKPVGCKNLNKLKDKDKIQSTCAIDGGKGITNISPNSIPGEIEQNLPTILPPIRPIIKENSSYIIPSPSSKINQTNHLIPFDPNNILEHNNNSVNQNLPEVTTSQGSFNKWLTDQMKNLESVNSISQPINFGALEQLILDALQKHGVLVSPSGVITDASGHVFNITNLYLRPLLIGESIKFNSVKTNPNGSYALPEISSYMESVLIAVLDPPNVVAVIPLGKVDVPKTFDFRHILYQRGVQQNNRDRNNFAINHLSSDKYLLPKNKNVYRLIPSSYFKTENNHLKLKDMRRILKDSQTYTHPVIKHDDLKGRRKEVAMEDFVPSTQFTEISLEPEDAEKEHDKNKIPPYIMHPSDLKNTQSSPIKLDNDDDDDGDDAFDDDDLDYVDFRIIGGAAATGSGIPISNRGRSGKLVLNR